MEQEPASELFRGGDAVDGDRDAQRGGAVQWARAGGDGIGGVWGGRGGDSGGDGVCESGVCELFAVEGEWGADVGGEV